MSVLDDAPVPAYGEASLADLTPSLLAALGVPGEANTLDLPAVRRACLVLVDGLGWEQLRDNRDVAPYLVGMAERRLGSAVDPVHGGRVLTAGFPATTATSMGSLGTGLTPAEHGLLGLRVSVPGTDRLMNCLHWDTGVDPVSWQPRPTVFERAEAAGVAASHHAPGSFREGGLTKAALRGSRYVAADSPGELVATAGEALRASDRALTCVYHADLDATGHRKGCRSAAWRFQLSHVDRLVEQLAGVLPPDAALYVTADHGMVDIDPGDRVDADSVPELREGVSLLGGEARARHIYTRSGAADDVLATWRGLLGERMWIASRAEAVASGWFGPEVPDGMLERIGDVVAAARDGVAVIASKAEPAESALVGQHGSMTPAEQLVPLLDYTAG